MDMLWIEKEELLSYIKAYFSSDSDHSSCTVEIVRDNLPLAWHENVGTEIEVVARPVEFFVTAQCYPVTQIVDCLVEDICNTLSDICRTNYIRIRASDPGAWVRHYITLRSPHQVSHAPSGTLMLSIVASVFSEVDGRELFV